MEKLLFKRDQWKLIKASLAKEEQNNALSMLHFTDQKLYVTNAKILVAIDRAEIGSKDIKPGNYMLVSIGRPAGNFIEVIVEPVKDVDYPNCKNYMEPAAPAKDQIALVLKRPSGKEKENGLWTLTRAALRIKQETGANINIFYLEMLSLLDGADWTLHKPPEDKRPARVARLSAGNNIDVTICAFN